MISIYDYSDYRLFIKEYKEEHEKEDSKFSLRYLAYRAGISSTSFYSHIINGKRNLSKKTIAKTATALKLSERESDYFENLVFFNQTKDVDEKTNFFEELTKIRKYSRISPVEPEKYEYFSKWYHCAVRELICYLDSGADYIKIASYLEPRVSPNEVEKSVKMLLKLGFLKNVNGRIEQSEPLLSSESDTEFKQHRILSFQLKMLELSRSAYSTHSPMRRLSSATSFSISKKTYVEFAEILRTTRQKLMHITENDESPEDVYLLNMHLFPLTKQFIRDED